MSKSFLQLKSSWASSTLPCLLSCDLAIGWWRNQQWFCRILPYFISHRNIKCPFFETMDFALLLGAVQEYPRTVQNPGDTEVCVVCVDIILHFPNQSASNPQAFGQFSVLQCSSQRLRWGPPVASGTATLGTGRVCRHHHVTWREKVGFSGRCSMRILMNLNENQDWAVIRC